MRRFLVALALAVTLPLPVLAGQVTVREGETLSEIAERHGISLDRLMQINGIRDADLVEAGRKLTIPGSGGGSSAASGRTAASGTVTVRDGETLSEIAERHGIGLTRLMQINGIRNADQVQAGQTLRLQGTAGTVARAAATPARPSYPAGANEHVVRSGESLSGIASGYGIGLSKLLAINGISDPDHVEAGTRLRLKGTPQTPSPRPAVTTAAVSASSPRPQAQPQPQAAPARPSAATRPAAPTTTPTAAVRPVTATTPAVRPATPAARPAALATTVAMARADWRTYGPLQVNWAGWQPMGGSMVAPTLNRQGQTLYLAINCGARKVNSTTPSGEWQSWNDPRGNDEQQLVTDYCRSRS